MGNSSDLRSCLTNLPIRFDIEYATPSTLPLDKWPSRPLLTSLGYVMCLPPYFPWCHVSPPPYFPWCHVSPPPYFPWCHVARPADEEMHYALAGYPTGRNVSADSHVSFVRGRAYPLPVLPPPCPYPLTLSLTLPLPFPPYPHLALALGPWPCPRPSPPHRGVWSPVERPPHPTVPLCALLTLLLVPLVTSHSTTRLDTCQVLRHPRCGRRDLRPVHRGSQGQEERRVGGEGRQDRQSRPPALPLGESTPIPTSPLPPHLPLVTRGHPHLTTPW